MPLHSWSFTMLGYLMPWTGSPSRDCPSVLTLHNTILTMYCQRFTLILTLLSDAKHLYTSYILWMWRSLAFGLLGIQHYYPRPGECPFTIHLCVVVEAIILWLELMGVQCNSMYHSSRQQNTAFFCNVPACISVGIFVEHSLLVYKTVLSEDQSGTLHNHRDGRTSHFPLSLSEFANLPMWDCTETTKIKPGLRQ